MAEAARGGRPLPGHGRRRRRGHPRRGQGRDARRDVRRHPRRERPDDAAADPPLPARDRAGRGGGPGRGARRGGAHPAGPRARRCRPARGRERGRAGEPPDEAARGEDRDRHRRAWGRFTRNFVVQGTGAEWALCWLADLRNRLWRLGGAARCDARPHLVFFLHDEVVVHTPAAAGRRGRRGGAQAAAEAAAGCCSAASPSTSRSTSPWCGPGPTPAEHGAGPHRAWPSDWALLLNAEHPCTQRRTG